MIERRDTGDIISHTKPAKVLSPPLPKMQSRRSLSAWQPQQSSLTRDGSRAIILEQIGQYPTRYGRNIRHRGEQTPPK
jgi:hypothetical protein